MPSLMGVVTPFPPSLFHVHASCCVRFMVMARTARTSSPYLTPCLRYVQLRPAFGMSRRFVQVYALEATCRTMAVAASTCLTVDQVSSGLGSAKYRHSDFTNTLRLALNRLVILQLSKSCLLIPKGQCLYILESFSAPSELHRSRPPYLRGIALNSCST